MRRLSVNQGCSCRKCTTTPFHRHHRLHNFIRRLVCVLDGERLIEVIAAIHASLKECELDIILCELANISIADLRRADGLHLALVREAETRAEHARDNFTAFAQDEISAEVLKCVSRGWWLPMSEDVPLHLMINDRPYTVFVPRDSGGWALQEILFLDTYRHSPIPVDDIYDLGAFIGLSALYLNSLYPGSTLTCVEPAPANFRFLEKNLRSNLIAFSVLPVALAGSTTFVKMAMSPVPSMMNSGNWEYPGHSPQFASAVVLSDIISSKSYGIKMDIEGAEFALRPCANILKGAKWIVGELHFGETLQTEDIWLLDLLRSHFDLDMAPARFSECGSTYVVAQEFRAVRQGS